MVMRLIDADAIRVKAEYLQNICGIVMIRAEDLARIVNEQPTIPYDMNTNTTSNCDNCTFRGQWCEKENKCSLLKEQKSGEN